MGKCISSLCGFRGLENVPRFGFSRCLCLQGCYPAGEIWLMKHMIISSSIGKSWIGAIPIALNRKLGRPFKNWTCRFGQDRLPPRSGWWAEDPWSLTLNSMPGSEQSVLVEQLYFTLSGTLPISTEQTLMAGRLGRLVLQTNLEGIAWRNEGPKISCCLKEVTWELVPPWCSPLWCNRFTSRVWATSAPWTWSLSLPSLPRPWGLAGGSTTSHSPPGTCSPAWRIFEHASHDSMT